jgi:hypothetical protein
MGRLELVVGLLAIVNVMDKKKKLGPWTKEKLTNMLHKIVWEGGIFEAFNGYGIRSKDYDVDDQRLDELINNLDYAHECLEAYIEELKDKFKISDEEAEP